MTGLMRCAVLVLCLPAVAAAQHEHHQPQTPAPQPPAAGQEAAPAPLPRLGSASQEPAYTLAQLEELALARNPTLRQAQAEIRAARGRRSQAGLYPNPVVGYTGEEIRGGKLGGGQHGAFVEQTIVLGGKRGLSQGIFEREVRLAEIEAEEQRLRVLNSVRLAYYQVLAAQELLQTRRDGARLVEDALHTARRLRNVGAGDEAEVLMAEVELQQAELAVIRQENHLQRVWAALAAVAGQPGLPLGAVAGDLEAAPVLDEDQVLRALLQESPAVRISRVSVERAEAILQRARREAVPDLQLRAGVQQNRELLVPGRRVGAQGFAEVGFQLPLFNRNQGNVEAAQAETERSQGEAERVQLVLRERAAAALQSYRNARAMAGRYREQVLPRARRAYEMMLTGWGQMAASYPQVLMAQRTWFQLHEDYIGALENVWTTSVALQGFLLVDGLEAPARPGEMDVPVREINIPMTRGAARREE
jgi:cobalt-zinc-cadmium efflux system outer membrane protein